MSPKRPTTFSVWRAVKENYSGRPQQERFDAASDSERIRWGIFMRLMNSALFAILFASWHAEPLWAWAVGAAVMAAPLSYGLYRYCIRLSEERRADPSRALRRPD